eukprot:TRINITY_DN4643_c0_g1_i1.p1 TRINITY_DN4643_c0_g1~~TRINITY_DN4643_c0_g1_i1.p1  ORF type:complete len:583 (+),score=121.12 TRINITY_DN4643_c0_g1_i1:85-1833(+)
MAGPRTTLYFVLLLAASAEPWGCSEAESDVVTLLHAKQEARVQKKLPAKEAMAEGGIGQAFASAMAPSALLFTVQVKANASQAASPAPASVLAQLSSGESGDSGGFVALFAIFLLGGFVVSCCAICATTALISLGKDDIGRREQLNESRRRVLGAIRGMGVSKPRHAPPPPISGLQFQVGDRQVIVEKPLEGGRLGVDLTEDSLVVTDFVDPRASSYVGGFQVGDRLTHVNGIPVFKQADFVHILAGAMKENYSSGRPLVISVTDGLSQKAATPQTTMPPGAGLPSNICGRWRCDSGEMYTIGQLPDGTLGIEVTSVTQDAARGILTSTGPELQSFLKGGDGRPFGELRISHSDGENGLTSYFRAAAASDFGMGRKVFRVDNLEDTQDYATVGMPPIGSSNGHANAMSRPQAAASRRSGPTDMAMPRLQPAQPQTLNIPGNPFSTSQVPVTMPPAATQPVPDRLLAAAVGAAPAPPGAMSLPPATQLPAAVSMGALRQQGSPASQSLPPEAMVQIEQHAQELFAMLETDGSDKLTRQGMPAAQSLSPEAMALVEQRAKDLFDKLDKDRSGTITRKELEAGLR